ncbi:biotin-dependent carboxyltransferase family protein [Marinobacter caseinilyticus]|uniref:5-oxoprolinase subunit C family protein n=1 Tax=Marinobacter caseinilyticus TaxID=2692195 RepID=UPI00140C4A96|nr:biotin-dependent carboxyltransferase family protein [Marinobacter caseinilyticus]
MSELVIRRPGWQSTIQDEGRRGYYREGLSEGGAMDVHAFYWANKLLDNDLSSACIEVLMGQFEAEFSAAGVISVTGADLSFRINGVECETWCTHRVEAGDAIAFERPRSGLRAYLGVVGGWQTPVCFGSRSVVMREQLGGLDGGALKKQDVLPYAYDRESVLRQVNPHYVPDYSQALTLKVVPGYQYREFSKADRQLFAQTEYEVSDQVDRMGYKLRGPPISAARRHLISEGIAYGAIQVPQDGQPIVLLKDRQTIGGYPKIGCVASLDAARLSQCVPGSKVAFEFASVARVQSERKQFDRFFKTPLWHAGKKA